jgi:hypothetical protein
MQLIFDKEAHGSAASSNISSTYLMGEVGDCLDSSIKMLLHSATVSFLFKYIERCFVFSLFLSNVF